MKKSLLSIILCLTIGYSFAQNGEKPKPQFRINGYALYAFDDAIDSYYSGGVYYDGKIKGGFEWGGGLEYMLKPTYGLELSYLRLDTTVPFNIGPAHTTFDLASNYILLGGNRYMHTSNPKIEPYGGLQLGVAILDVSNSDAAYNISDSATKFAWGLKLGVNIWASPKVGIKLQTGLLSAVQGAGGGLYFGTGGAGAGVSTYSTMLQFNVGGGLTFKLGE